MACSYSHSTLTIEFEEIPETPTKGNKPIDEKSSVPGRMERIYFKQDRLLEKNMYSLPFAFCFFFYNVACIVKSRCIGMDYCCLLKRER